MVVKYVVAVIGGAFLGGVVGSVIRGIVIMAIPVNSASAAESLRDITLLIPLACMIIGAWKLHGLVSSREQNSSEIIYRRPDDK
jgi:tetrahydromethanopterin S-methyltransferase subunit C